jgi:hypothetical protein
MGADKSNRLASRNPANRFDAGTSTAHRAGNGLARRYEVVPAMM